MKTERQKLPRAWQYTIIGESVLLVFAVIITGLLAFANLRASPSSRIVPTSTNSSPTISNTVARETTLPTPVATPIPAFISSGHNVSVTIANGVAYLSTDDNVAYALQISNGAMLWHHSIDGPVDQPPLVTNGIVYMTSFINQNGPAHIYALRASDGRILWHYTMNNGKNSWASWLSVKDGVVYASANTDITGTQGLGDIYALQSSNGAVLWHDKFNRSPDAALLVNDTIYISTSAGSSDGTNYALHAHDGSLLWDYPILGPVFNPPILDGATVYIGETDGMVYALRADDGRIVWHHLIQDGGLAALTLAFSWFILLAIVRSIQTRLRLGNKRTPGKSQA
ncbi:MAG: PQQ-binding-like beta-propeller repeat protein [Ktedonobacteraceae bacterium]